MKIFAISDTHGNLEGLDPSGSDIEDKETLCQVLHDQYGGNWTWSEE